ncbi:MAG: DUF6171 family protein [Treponema sp.]|nr:DUF6171 family protein [Treponema sp.]
MDREDCPYCGRGAALPSAEEALRLAHEAPVAEGLRAEEPVYERRLAVCASCACLREGILCAHCGCFVQFRALPRVSYCPHPEGDKWFAT